MYGKNIKIIRKERNLNQDEFAKPLEITGKTISAIETGRAIPSNRVLQLIEKNYLINRKWLKTGQGEKYIKPQEAVETPQKGYDLHGGYTGHTTNEFTGDEKMSAAVNNLMKIYESGNKSLISTVSRALIQFVKEIKGKG